MTTKHTPAPWELTKHEDCEASIVTAGHESICFVYIDDNDKPATENNKADARLIAAAPELLEALEAARDEIGEDWCDTVNEFNELPIIRKIDAAIAKAKGGAA